MQTRKQLRAGVFTFAIFVAANAVDPIEPFVIARDDPADFNPLGEIVTAGSIAFMPGLSASTNPAGDTILIAFDARRRRDAWRAALGAQGSYT